MITAYTEPTTRYWQALLGPEDPRLALAPPWRFAYPARLVDGRGLVLPLRALPDGRNALASLIANQASFEVVDALAALMALEARAFEADVVVGLPTLGLAVAPQLARALGHPRFVPLGYSRKFWYRADLAEPVRSITSPDGGKDLFIDPNLVPLVMHRRAVLVDDAVSSGETMAVAMKLMRRLDVEVAGVVVAMKQTRRWEKTLAATPVKGVLGCPLFERVDTGWTPVAGTQPALP